MGCPLGGSSSFSRTEAHGGPRQQMWGGSVNPGDDNEGAEAGDGQDSHT